MMRKKYIFFRVEYGRYGGRMKVTRYCKLNESGMTTYVEKRMPRDDTVKKEQCWKVGNIKFWNFSAHSIQPSSRYEYTKMLATAMKQINP